MYGNAELEDCPEILMVIDEHRRTLGLHWHDMRGNPRETSFRIAALDCGDYAGAYDIRRDTALQAAPREGWPEEDTEDEYGFILMHCTGIREHIAIRPGESDEYEEYSWWLLESELGEDDWEALCASLAPYIQGGAEGTEWEQAGQDDDRLNARVRRQRSLDDKMLLCPHGPTGRKLDGKFKHLQHRRATWTELTRQHRRYVIDRRRAAE